MSSITASEYLNEFYNLYGNEGEHFEDSQLHLLGYNITKLKECERSSYLKLLFLPRKMPLIISGSKIIIASGAKPPKMNEEGEIPKNVTFMIKNMSPEVIAGGSYSPNVMETEEEQNEENKRVEKVLNEYSMATNNMALCLELIEREIQEKIFPALYPEIMEGKGNTKVMVRGAMKKIDKKCNPNECETFLDGVICTFKQESYTEGGEEKELENAIFRVRLQVANGDPEGKIGTMFDGEYKPIIFNLRKMVHGKSTAGIPATIKYPNGKNVYPTYKNVKQIVSYKSLAFLNISIELAFSVRGVSIIPKCREIYVATYKYKSEGAKFKKEELKLDFDNDGSDIEIEDEEKENDDNGKKNQFKADDEEDDVAEFTSLNQE